MTKDSKYLNITYGKLQLSDYQKFKKLFYLTFKKKISYNFYKWRYFNDKFSFCYGAFLSSQLIANVGFKSFRLNNNNKKSNIALSRHSSMVLRKYQGKGIYSKLLQNVKKNYLTNIKAIIMWPNKKNFSNFGHLKKNIINKNLYIYKIKNNIKKIDKTSYNKIDQLKNYKKKIINPDNFFYKDFSYLKYRYLEFNSKDYLLNQFKFNELNSFYILKKQKKFDYIILEHFGSKKIKYKHFLSLKSANKTITFSSMHKLKNSKHKLINTINLKIIYLKKINNNNKNMLKKEFILGDTDSFITLK